MSGQTVSASVDVSASPGQVWNAITDPDLIKKYFFGTQVESTFEPGSPITWSGEYDGKSYRDHGEVLEAVPEERLVVTHFSAMSGQDDVPENYHRVTYQLEDAGDSTRVTLEQDNTPEEAVDDFRTNWETMLGNLKELVERG
jgi:uncharacterized protein YndB with AHSA1/START domain